MALKGQLSGSKNPSWKGGLPKCRFCPKILSDRKRKTCRQHRLGLNYKRKEKVLKATKRYSLDTIKKLSEAKRGRTGELANNWKGGKSLLRDYPAVCSTNRRARIKGCEGKYTVEEWEALKKAYNFTCPACGEKEPEISLTADHIIPVKFQGSNTIDNIQPLCLSCNSSKKTKTTRYAIA
jgi:5-methylcytosine-specific restriction endonuclease McrA